MVPGLPQGRPRLQAGGKSSKLCVIMAIRLFFLLLLAANVFFYLHAAGYMGSLATGREPERLQNQLKPEAISLLPPQQGGENRKAVAADSTSDPAKAVVPVLSPICLSLSGTADAVARATSHLRPAAKEGLQVNERTVSGGVRYWVLISGFTTQGEAALAADRLRGQGVADVAVMTDDRALGPVVSLGLYRTEAGARERLAGLRLQGVRNARLTSRNYGDARLALDLTGMPDVVRKWADRVGGASSGLSRLECQVQHGR